jgi:hypothetical protein
VNFVRTDLAFTGNNYILALIKSQKTRSTFLFV